MQATEFLDILGADFFVGVPDSQLRALCDALMERYGNHAPHIIAANEGTAAGIAAGHYLATGRSPLVYLQNSGEGNIVNALASLLHEKAYAIPLIFVIGWRGEPGVKDEPQHAYQEDVRAAMERFRSSLEEERSVAFVVRKGALTHDTKVSYKNGYRLRREEAIRTILDAADEGDVFVSTTGKASRELFELREARGEGHERDFLTIGSMGHSSSIALGIALEKKGRRTWCLDGDGAFLMHMGAAAVIAAAKPSNFCHVVLNNEAHESVGGMPTAASSIDFPALARALGYAAAWRAKDGEEIAAALEEMKGQAGPCFLEVRCAVGSRADLGRPTIPPKANKLAMMRFLGY